MLDITREPWFAPLVGVLVLLAASITAGAVARFVLQRAFSHAARHTSHNIDTTLQQHGVFKWLGRLIPVVVVQAGFDLVPGVPVSVAHGVEKLVLALVVLLTNITIGSVLSALEQVYRATRQDTPRVSLKGAMQLVKLLLYIAATLIIIGIVTGKQIGLLLSGIGAMSAVLMLIFKDTILGLVAGVQLSSNDMLRIDDWITMPSAGADGTVIDITLNTVKVVNFDNTIITIPTWKLITESYQNWRGMTESGGRRIKRALFIDATSVRFLEDDELAHLEKLTLLKTYLEEKRGAIEQWNDALGQAAESAANRRQLTNLGTFRAYVAAYLAQHPRIHHGMACMVRQLPMASEGVPLELYCFTNTTSWADYEDIQSDLFDHLIAVLPDFDLLIYQNPSGFDMRAGLGQTGRQASGFKTLAAS